MLSADINLQKKLTLRLENFRKYRISNGERSVTDIVDEKIEPKEEVKKEKVIKLKKEVEPKKGSFFTRFFFSEYA